MKIYIDISITQKTKLITINVKPTDMIKDIKQLIINKKEDMKDNFKLILNESICVNSKMKFYELCETELDDNIMISKYNIKDGTVINIL